VNQYKRGCFNQYVAIEGSWGDTGRLEDFDDGGTPRNISTNDDVSLRVQPKLYGASVVGSLPFADIYAVNARVGMSHWKTDVTAAVGAAAVGFSDSGDDLSWGIGLSGRLDGALVRLEYEQTDFTVDEIPGAELDVTSSQITLGVMWLF